MAERVKILPLVPPPLDPAWWEGQVVWLSGATGSWGWEFVRQLLDLPIAKLICFCRGEYRAYQLENYYNDARLRIHLGDIRSSTRLRESFSAGPSLVIHGAACKRIDSAAYAPEEFYKTNVEGTWSVIEACLWQPEKSVKRAWFVSTDKAFEPITFYGGTKFVAEQLWLLANNYARGPQFLAARFGNALWSTGSVLWTWKEQAEASKPLSLTSPAMTRFLLTLAEAVRFSLSAIELAEPGILLVPALPACSILDLASTMSRVGTQEIGIRGVEKLHEGLCEGARSDTAPRLSSDALYGKVWRAYHALPPPLRKDLL